MPRPIYTGPPNAAPSLGDPNFSTNASGYLGWFPTFGAYTEAMADWFESDFAKALGNGTAALPSMAFATDPDLGFYRIDDNHIGASTGGVRRWSLSNTAMQVDVPITGTAVQSSFDDFTSGKALLVGAGGIGGLADTLVGVSPDYNTFHPLGFTRFIGHVTSSRTPINGPFGIIGAVGMQIFASPTRGLQLMGSAQNGPSGPARLAVRSYDVGWGPWSEIFHNQNILGTVSQAAGVPTGAVMEKPVSNANGFYRKHADGWMECWRSITLSAGAGTTWTFPSGAFLEAPVVTGMAIATVASSVQADSAPTTTSVVLSARDKADARRADVALVHAVGRWSALT